MKKILIVSEFFYPNNVIGARRPTKIARKLHEKGYCVDVFSRYAADDISHICDKLFSFESYAQNDAKTGAVSARSHGKLYNELYRNLSTAKILSNAVNVLKIFKNKIPSDSSYDTVFSSFGPFSSLVCGLYYKKKHPETKWICDFRDPVVVKYIPRLWRPFFRFFEKTACKNADAIVAVSNGYLERICKGKYSEKSFMIPNGFDLEDMVFSTDIEKSKDVMKITYVGALYGGDRDLSPLFKALGELINEGVIDSDKLRVLYAGKEYAVIENQASKYGLENIVENCGVLSGEDCLRLQFSSHMLLLSTWNDKYEYGVFPGKLLEYMLIGKPIISLTCGDLPDGEVTHVIREGDLGVAYEASREDVDFVILKAYIKDAYNAWCETGEVDFSPKKDVLERYNYEAIIKRIEDLING